MFDSGSGLLTVEGSEVLPKHQTTTSVYCPSAQKVYQLRRSVQEQHNYTKHKFSGERKNDFYL